MKTKHTMTALMAIVALSLPAISFANTYQYINTSGNLASVEASNSTIALATAPQLALHSGVILENSFDLLSSSVTTKNVVFTGTGGANLYAYVKSNGEVGYVTANSVQAALATAPGIAYNSGVQVVVN